MGASLVYLDRPNTKKITSVGSVQGDNQQIGYKWAASEMQGWRLNMEDSHITNPTFDKEVGLFAVFDGHGGLECAKFCERYFEAKLREQPEFASRTDF